MKVKSVIPIQPANPYHRQAIIKLIEENKLPVLDLPVSLSNFFVAVDNGEVVGVIGLECWDEYGLLRSMVVKKEFRNQKLASRLVNGLETFGKAAGITSMYLLTETAAQYFENKNYKIITRAEVPTPLLASSEFSHVCPVSAIVMKKEIQ